MLLNNIKLGDKIIIYNNQNRYISFVENIVEDTNILFQNIYQYNKEVVLSLDDIYNFIIFTSDGKLNGSFKVIKFLQKSRRKFYLAEINNIITGSFNSNQRKNFRFICNFPYIINIIDENNIRNEVDCIIKDISLGGIRFSTNHFLKETFKVEITLNYDLQQFFYGVGKIIQYQNYPKSNYKNQYRVELFETNFKDKNSFEKILQNNIINKNFKDRGNLYD